MKTLATLAIILFLRDFLFGPHDAVSDNPNEVRTEARTHIQKLRTDIGGS